jgi:hypothetical protein
MGVPLAKNLRRVCHLDLAGGGQVFVADGYAYVGHMKPPHGTTIVDIRDPKNPRITAEIRLGDMRSHSHKVRVAGDIMITNVEQNERHAVRRASRLREAEAALAFRLGRSPSDAELGAQLGVTPHQLRLARDFAAKSYTEGGFRVWDVSDKAKPRLLSHVRTHGVGAHRFDMDERYAYISTEMEGFVGNMLVIYDLANPAQPEEVSRWWMPGQHIAAGEQPTWPGTSHRLHHALRHGNELWAAVWYAGLRVIDVGDIRAPQTIGAYNYHPPFPEPTHTVLRVPFDVAGRTIAVAADEEHDHTPGQLHAGLWVFDTGHLDDIRPIGMFHLSELDSPFARARARFGLHQFQEHIEDARLYCAWFAGGLRVIDIADPTLPTEVGYFIPEPIAGQVAPQTNDVDVDGRGLVAIIDRNVGFDILEWTG